MELKKSEEANNERLRYPMIFVGMLFTGSLVLASFTYSTPAKDKGDSQVAVRDTDAAFEEDVKVEDPPETPEVEQQAPITPPPQEVIKEKETEPEPPPRDPTPPPPPIPPGPKLQPKVKAEIVDFPDVEAAFPGGAAAMKKWIQQNVNYPEISRELGDQGRVYVTFVVEPDGSITGVGVMRGGVTEELNREAKRLVRNMPKWTPGSVKAQPVRARCRLPITFTLQ
ncbi:MAG: TonB family protein [Crocinitomicaceae bacterium]|nr:TonB family protein [Flavobacteriales bacterium]NQZ38387.1 TonB family protein [Crocinitomicaceae bacterium]PHR30763.1 MAG: energy transducer TonB [Fluviicola sp.]